jgi:Domain of unknown function (DUF1772)
VTISIIRFANIIIAALLAGTSFGIWIGFNPISYSASTYIEQQQNLVLSLNTLMISLVIIATLVTVLSAYLQRKNKIVFVALLFAALCFASCILISRLGNFPIQNDMLTWNANAIPDNWKMLRDKWWSFHIMRTVAELIALVLVAWTSVQKIVTEIK